MQWEDDQTIQNFFITNQVSCCKNGEPPPPPTTKTQKRWPLKIGDKCPKTLTWKIMKIHMRLFLHIHSLSLYTTSTLPIMHLICPPKFCIIFIIAAVPREMKTMLMQNFGGQIRCIMGNVEVVYVWKCRRENKDLQFFFPLFYFFTTID